MTLIQELWVCEDEAVWRFALKTYWLFVKREDRNLENEIDQLDRGEVQGFDRKGWYDFLFDKYFPWKFTVAAWLATARKRLEGQRQSENGLDKLYEIKEHLFALDHANPENIEDALKEAEKINGLATAGASGLLAVLFPEHFGTVDRFVVRALQAIDGLPQEDLLRHMKPEGFTPHEAAALINIMREKASDNNRKFNTNFWTPRKIDMILWTYGREDG
jgi:hypothetical protein